MWHPIKDHALLENIAESLADLVQIFTPRLSATLTYHHEGENMPVTLLVGQTANPTYQEWSGPNGTGDPLPPAGAVTYASSDATKVSVDPSSGVATGVALGSATITATDAANGLSASDAITVTEVAQSATLTFTPNAPAAAAKKAS